MAGQPSSGLPTGRVGESTQAKRENAVAIQNDDQFFLTGVNVQNQDIEQYDAGMEQPAQNTEPISARVEE